MKKLKLPSLTFLFFSLLLGGVLLIQPTYTSNAWFGKGKTIYYAFDIPPHYNYGEPGSCCKKSLTMHCKRVEAVNCERPQEPIEGGQQR
jgi:hypothetical protein